MCTLLTLSFFFHCLLLEKYIMRAYQPQPFYVRFPAARTTEPSEMTHNNDINVFNNNGVLSKNIAGVVTPIGYGTAYDQDLNTFNDVDFVTMHTTSYVQTDTIKSGDLSVTVTMPPSSGQMIATTATQTLTNKTWYEADNARVPLTGSIRKTALAAEDQYNIAADIDSVIATWADTYDTDASGPSSDNLGVANSHHARLRLIKPGYWRLTAKGTVNSPYSNPVLTFRMKVTDDGGTGNDYDSAVSIPGGRFSVVGDINDDTSFWFSTIYYKTATYATSHAYLFCRHSNTTSDVISVPVVGLEHSFEYSAEFLYS